MITKGKITVKKASLITVETSEGTVNVSLHKHGLEFLKMSRNNVGDEVTLDIEKSVAGSTYTTADGRVGTASGNAYLTQTNKVSQSLITAKKLLLEEANLTKAIEGL